MVKLEEALEVQTANGDVVISHKCCVYVVELDLWIFPWGPFVARMVSRTRGVYVVELDLWIWAHLLECTVAVLSLAALCSENGFSYTWKCGKEPSLVKGNLEVMCRPRNNVPFIFIVEGNLNPALSDEDAMIEEILEEIDPPPTPDEE